MSSKSVPLQEQYMQTLVAQARLLAVQELGPAASESEIAALTASLLSQASFLALQMSVAKGIAKGE